MPVDDGTVVTLTVTFKGGAAGFETGTLEAQRIGQAVFVTARPHGSASCTFLMSSGNATLLASALRALAATNYEGESPCPSPPPPPSRARRPFRLLDWRTWF